jgi:uncharacterized damage-inducible protein DinB
MQNSVVLLRRLHQHRAWVNENLLASASKLSEDQLRQPFQIGQGSIWKSLLHMYAAEFVWLDALLGKEKSSVPGDLPGQLPGNQFGEGGITSFNDLRTKWTDLEKRWIDYLSGLSAESLDDLVCRVSSKGQRLVTRRSDVLLHVCTHAHYTVAQVVNMFRLVGVDPLPETMLISLARKEEHPR